MKAPLAICLALFLVPSASHGESPAHSAPGYPPKLIYGGNGMIGLMCRDDESAACVNEAAAYFNGFGISVTRKTLSWLFTEFEQGQYTWDKLDMIFSSLVNNGVTIVCLISDMPLWASDPTAKEILRDQGRDRFVGCLQNEPEHWPDYERWLTLAIQRYGHLIDYYEVWNEPDGMCGLYPKYWQGRVGGVGMGGDPDWYAEFFKRTSRIIHEYDPVAAVAVGGMEDKRGLQIEWFEGLYQRGCKPFIDAVCIHPYGDPFGQPFDRKWLRAVRDVMAKYGDEHKPLWITEYNVEGKGELDMSFTVRRKLRLLRETPWLPIATPLGLQYFFYGKAQPNWPLQAIRRMLDSETGPRTEYRQDFELPAMELFRQWEWRASSEDGQAWPELGVKYLEGRDESNGLVAEGDSLAKSVRVWFEPYVRSEDPRIELWYMVFQESINAPLYLKTGVECMDVLEPVRETEVTAIEPDAFEWNRYTFRVADVWPDWKEKGINLFWIEFSSTDPGITVAVDDVWVR